MSLPAGAALFRERASLVLAVLAGTVTFFHRALLTEEIFISRDMQRVYYPLRQFWVEQVLGGRFPLWYPYDGLGQPFVGMVISGAFHPSNLLYLVLPIEAALKLNVVVCFPLAFAGAFLLARRWTASLPAAVVAGLVFAFNGYMVSITNNLLYLMAAAQVPWALWAADHYFARGGPLRGLAAAALHALILFGGDTQSFALCCAASIVLAVLRSGSVPLAPLVTRAASLLLLAGGLAMVQLLPALAVFDDAAPGGQSSARVAMRWSMHPLRVVEMGLGPLFVDEVGGPLPEFVARHVLKAQMASLWVNSVHVGLPALLLAGLGLAAHRRSWRAWGLLVAGGAALLLAFGKHGGLYTLAYELLPLWRPFRYPEKLFPFVALALALGASLGAAWVLAGSERLRRLGLALALLGAVCAGLAWLEGSQGLWARALVGLASSPAPAGLPEHLSGLFVSAAVKTALTTLPLGLLLAVLARRALASALLPLGIFVQLFASGAERYELSIPEVLSTPPPFVEAIRAQEGAPVLGKPRVMTGLDVFAFPRVEGLSNEDLYAALTAVGFEPVTPALWGLEGWSQYLPAVSRRVAGLVTADERNLGELAPKYGTRYATVRNSSIKGLERPIRVVAEVNSLRLSLVEWTGALPRAYLAPPRCVASPQEALAAVRAPGFDGRTQSVIECDPSEAPPATLSAPAGTATLVRHEPTRVEISTESPTGVLLVLNDAYYSGWSVEIDAQPAPLYRANYAARGVLLPAGKRSVVFRYTAPGLLAGLCASVATVFAALACELARRLRRRAKSTRATTPTSVTPEQTAPAVSYSKTIS